MAVYLAQEHHIVDKSILLGYFILQILTFLFMEVFALGCTVGLNVTKDRAVACRQRELVFTWHINCVESTCSRLISIWISINLQTQRQQ